MPTFTTLSTLRMTKREVDHFTASLGLTNVQVARDRGGYYVRQCEAAEDPLPAVFAQLRRELRDQRAQARRDRGGRVKGSTTALRSHITGVCARVREWAGEHPQASVQDAVAAFPEANKTTVRIQFKKAHG